MNGRTAPHNLEAEEAVLGTMLMSRQARDEACDLLTSADFYAPAHRLIFQAVLDVTASGLAVDRVVLGVRLAELGGTLDDATLQRLRTATPALGNIRAEAALLARLAAARRAITVLDRALDSAWDGEIDQTIDVLHRAEELLAPPFESVEPPIGASLLASEDHTVDWIVTDWLARHEIVLFVAEPGSGKTTLLNQTAMLLASAMHPWTRVDLHAPIQCLVFDFQDSRGARGRSVQRLLDIAGQRYPANRGEPDTLFYELRTQGVDLTSRVDQRWFEAKVVACKPDVIVAGPLYNMVSGAAGRSKQSEETAEMAGQFLSELCIRRNCALLVEAHAPHGDELRVRGSKYWEDWAGWGLGLVASLVDGKREFYIRRFRGDREAGRAWPTHWTQGHAELWPWEALGMPTSNVHPDQEKF